jgi:hypothetical protein
MLLLLGEQGGGGAGEVLAAGDLTTAFSKWLATKGHPKNEAIRAALNTSYSTTYADIQPLVSRFLRDRA